MCTNERQRHIPFADHGPGLRLNPNFVKGMRTVFLGSTMASHWPT